MAARTAAAHAATLPVVTTGCGCGCGTTGPDAAGADAGTRTAVAVDPAIKARNRTRLRRIEGQVRGIQQMVENERYCADVLVQISAVQEALRSVSRELMRNHLKHCASAAIRGTPEAANAMYDELTDLIYKHAR
ncbi:MAG TPA: metal-sensitive transcriptional regulator [Gemmatirosa sp.]